MTTIRRMMVEDVPIIKEIQDSYILGNKNPGEAEKTGFFIRALSNEDITKYVLDPQRCSLVSLKGSEINGYLLGAFPQKERFYDKRIKHASFSNDFYKRKLLEEGHVHLSYVAKRKNVSPRVVIELEDEIFAEARRRAIFNGLGLIALQPYNKRSWDFHKKRNFLQVGELSENYNGMAIIWGLVYKNLREDGHDPKQTQNNLNPTPFRDSYRDKLIAKVNSGGGWYNGDENSAREELEEYEEQIRRTDHDTD